MKALPYGDPREPNTVVGPLISEDDAVRVDAWIEEAVAQGREAPRGRRAQGAVVPPTLLAGDRRLDEGRLPRGVRPDPVHRAVRLARRGDRAGQRDALRSGDCGVFTNRLDDAFAAARRLEVGGVHVNETSSSRVDMMPYGGSKDSGFGREGPRYAVHEMTEERMVTITMENTR